MKDFKVVRIMVLVVMLIFTMQACSAWLQSKPETVLEESWRATRVAQATAMHTAVGNKLLDTKRTIVNECMTNILLSKDDCTNVKKYYNLSADLHHVTTNMLRAVVDEENQQKYMDEALDDVLKLSGNAKYTGIGTAAVTQIISIIKDYPGLSPMARTEKVLIVLQNEVLDVVIQVLQKKIEVEGGNN